MYPFGLQRLNKDSSMTRCSVGHTPLQKQENKLKSVCYIEYSNTNKKFPLINIEQSGAVAENYTTFILDNIDGIMVNNHIARMLRTKGWH